MCARQRIRDPLHNIIEFDDDDFYRKLWSVVQTKPLQRLRRIKQLGFSDLVYPGATHSRYVHSLGTFYVSRRLMGCVRRSMGKNLDEIREKAVYAAALVHDIGHGPFSHAFEDAMKRTFKNDYQPHEKTSVRLIREGEIAEELDKFIMGFSQEVASIIDGTSIYPTYSSVISSQFDADRLDYMQRDRLMTGTALGTVDFEWLLSNLEVGDVPSGVDDEDMGFLSSLIINHKGLMAAESYVLNLFHMYKTVYLHKTTRGAEKIFSELFYRVISRIREGNLSQTGLNEKNPICLFIEENTNLDRFLALDDAVFWSSFVDIATRSKDPVISDLADRLLNRRLYKCIDIRETLQEKLFLYLKQDFSGDIKRAIDRACLEIRSDIEIWNNDHDEKKEELILMDSGERSPYKNESGGNLLSPQIWVNVFGQVRNIKDVSNLVSCLKPFEWFRCYVPMRNGNAAKFVDEKIKDT